MKRKYKNDVVLGEPNVIIVCILPCKAKYKMRARVGMRQNFKYAFVKIKVVLAYARKLLQIHVFCGIIAL